MLSQSKNLKLKRYFSIVAHSPNIVELRHGVWNPTSFTLTDEAESDHLSRILTRLDGSLSPRELARTENIPQEEVETLLDHLVELGVVESGASSSLDYYLDHIVPTLQPMDSTPVHRPILLLGDGDVTSEIQRSLRDSLKDTEVTILPTGDPAWEVLSENDASWLMNGLTFEEKVGLFESWQNKVVVYATKVINPLQLQIMNRVTLKHRIPWICAALDGPFLFIGPTFVPYRSACYECFETRVLMNLREGASYQRYKQALAEGSIKGGELPIEPTLIRLLASHTALETLNFVLTGTTFTFSKVLAIYLPTMEFTFNEVFKVPGCKACGPVAGRDDKELYFDVRALIHGQ